MYFVFFVFIQFIKKIQGALQGDQAGGKEVHCQNEISLCELYFSTHLQILIIPFLSKDRGCGGEKYGLASRTDCSVLCSNIMNQCIL